MYIMDSSDTVSLIIEYISDESDQSVTEKLNRIGKVKYRLPIINSYVLEVARSEVEKITSIENVKSICEASEIKAQINASRKTIGADSPALKTLSGRGVTIAVLDTGTALLDDFTKPKNRLLCFKDFVNGKTSFYDDNGHGTHVTGIAAGSGYTSGGKYCGIAPNSNIISLKVLDEEGKGSSGDVLAGIQWVVDNKDIYNIRIVNLSVGTPDLGSFDPLVRAVEKAWDLGMVVICAAGNNGPGRGSITSPGISRKAITVGASDDSEHPVRIWGDRLVDFSGRGPTSECIIKPDILAPGRNIVSCVSNCMSERSYKSHKEKMLDNNYMRLSGTSMATPMVSGAVALLLEKHPKLSPDDVKYMLKLRSTDLNQPGNQQGWGLLNIEKLVSGEANYVRKTDIRNSSNDAKQGYYRK